MAGKGPGRPVRGEGPEDLEREIHEVAEEFLDRLLGGESPDREALAAAHPHIRERLSRRLALVELLFLSRPRT